MPAALAPATVFQAEAISAAIQTATGQRPTIIYRENTAQILFTKEAAAKIQQFIEMQLKKQSNVKIEAAPIIFPLVIKKLGPIVAGAALALFFIGYIAGRK